MQVERFGTSEGGHQLIVEELHPFPVFVEGPKDFPDKVFAVRFGGHSLGALINLRSDGEQCLSGCVALIRRAC